MDYLQALQYHYKPKKGWVNDPNGLVYYKGYYHIFYQHCPNCERAAEPMRWGHARTRDFLSFEELPIALTPDTPYDCGGCWSGTAIEVDGRLYLFYAAISPNEEGGSAHQRVAVAWSDDGITFQKYENNPIIPSFPADGCEDFRDPAVLRRGEDFYLVMASGHRPTKTGRLLLYHSKNLLDWQYVGIMSEWQNAICTECPSFVHAGEEYLLATSVCRSDEHFFSVAYGDFDGKTFTARLVGEVDKGPDQYAGQVFTDHKGRNILISWLPGWAYQGYAARDVGCMSLPKELFVKDGKLHGYPIEEVRHLLKEEDEAVVRTQQGFTVQRQGREPLVYRGEVRDLKILRDGYILEIFLNGGEEVYSVLL